MWITENTNSQSQPGQTTVYGKAAHDYRLCTRSVGTSKGARSARDHEYSSCQQSTVSLFWGCVYREETDIRDAEADTGKPPIARAYSIFLSNSYAKSSTR